MFITIAISGDCVAWKLSLIHILFLIQLLNIAGLGPIFGAVMGVLYGPAALLWIVIGCRCV